MAYLTGMLLCAGLFILFGVIRPRTECSGGGCGACGGICDRRNVDGGDVS
jgi:hypothetical protein